MSNDKQVLSPESIFALPRTETELKDCTDFCMHKGNGLSGSRFAICMDKNQNTTILSNDLSIKMVSTIM